MGHRTLDVRWPLARRSLDPIEEEGERHGGEQCRHDDAEGDAAGGDEAVVALVVQAEALEGALEAVQQVPEQAEATLLKANNK